MPPSITPQEFVAKWRHIELKERSAYQSHFNDICYLLGHPTPVDMDPAGAFFTFEAGASKASGGQGFADVWYKGHFAWEYKGKHANLDKAYQQLLQYREALQNPPLLITSDSETIVIHTNFTNSVKRVYPLKLEDLLQPDKLALLRQVFKNPEALKAPQTTEQVTQQAAAHFSRLAQILRDYGEDSEKVAHFLIQLLFCLFAEDVDLLPERTFSNLLSNSRHHSGAFVAQLRQLFAAMSLGGWFGAVKIPHFDGHLFDNDFVLELDSDGLAIVAKVAALDWSSIEPSVFGTLFERSLDPSKRSQLGAHYTSKEDILLIVEPVLMAPLRRRWQEVQSQARQIAADRDQAKGKPRATLENKLTGLLTAFAGEIADTRVLDPACGSGNFLYVALRQLLNLWKEVSLLAAELGLPQFLPVLTPTPSPEQLHGIEINEYAHQLAQATIWIGYWQWMRENGYGFREPILRPLNNIHKMDAILAFDEQGNPVEPEWPAADVIIGNPPFLGGGKLRGELGDHYVENLFALYGTRLPNFSDLVCYWFEKARYMIEIGQVKRAGLLATQGIRGGANRRVLERIKETGDIFWAQSDRDWILDGANVHVSMVGFDKSSETNIVLDGSKVANINPNLTTAINLTLASRLRENFGICFMGPSAKAPFDIDQKTARELLLAKGNPNQRSNADVIRPVASAVDLVQRSRQMWTIDFGLKSEAEASQYEKPFEYVKIVVYPIRSKNRRKSYAQKWWQYAEVRPGMREALENVNRFIATPGVSKHRVFVWLPTEVLCNQGTLVFARDDDYFFGVLQSKLHSIWALQMGTALEDRPRYTPTTTFETFPFPWPPGQEPAEDADPRLAAIAQAARELVQLRDNWLNPPGLSESELKKRTLTNLYNQRPTWLDLAHRKLDQAVFAAYGWPDDLSDEEILERLLALNLERARRRE